LAKKEINRYIYDGNVLLHEFAYAISERPKPIADDVGRLSFDKEEPTTNLITWVFDEGTFVPSAKITSEGTFSIISDYLGTPILSFDEKGNKVWERELDIYGNVRKGDNHFIPFLYQGQYYDEETGLAYNRFRYYNTETGGYISQDPIGLAGGMPNMYSYVRNSNAYIDKFGLYSDLLGSGMGHHLMPRSIAKSLGIADLSPNHAIAWYPNNGVGTADLHKQMHRNLIDEGIPFHGSKFKGTSDEFFEAAKKAYKDMDTKGFMKIPGTDNKLLKNVTPLEGLEKLQDLHKKGKIPCK
jgi:RHS repeat-associated protein